MSLILVEAFCFRSRNIIQRCKIISFSLLLCAFLILRLLLSEPDPAPSMIIVGSERFFCAWIWGRTTIFRMIDSDTHSASSHVSCRRKPAMLVCFRIVAHGLVKFSFPFMSNWNMNCYVVTMQEEKPAPLDRTIESICFVSLVEKGVNK